MLPAVLILTASALWGAAFPLMKALLQDQGGVVPGWWATLQFQTLRFAIAGIVVAGLAAVLVRRWPRAREWELGGLLAILVGAAMQLQIEALNHIGAAEVGFITQAYVVWVPLAVALLARRMPPWPVAVAAPLVLAGVAILSGITPAHLAFGLGEVLVICSSLGFAAQILVLGSSRYAACDGLQATWIMMGGIVVAGMPLLAATGPGLAALPACYPDMPSLAILVIVALAATAVPFWIINTFQRRVPESLAAILYTSEALAAALAAAFLPSLCSRLLVVDYPDEALGWTFVVAALLILAGCALAQLRPRSAGPGLARTRSL